MCAHIFSVHISYVASDLTFAQRDAIDAMLVDPHEQMDDPGWEDEPPNPTLPVGEEGMFFSAEGGEHTIWEELFKEEKRYAPKPRR